VSASAADYEVCRRLNARHGRTYYLATLLLPPAKRPSVHALYGFARYADEIVDDTASTLTLGQKQAALETLEREVMSGVGTHPATRALLDTLARWDIPVTYVTAFLTSMTMDLQVSSYKTFEDLLGYVEGSAAVIGLQMLPVLGTVVPLSVAAPYARDLGIAFQLTNFLRDVGEDLERDRLYLPTEDLDAFGVTWERLAHGIVDGPVRRLLAFEIARTREVYRTAAQGLRLLEPSSRPCIATALTLYGGILDQIEQQDFPVLRRRVSVGPVRRARVALPAVVAARRNTLAATGLGSWLAGPRRPTTSASE
jgi:phytoene synthase